MSDKEIIAIKEAKLAELKAENVRLKFAKEQLEYEREQLQRMLFGRKSERYVSETPDSQLSLFEKAIEEKEEVTVKEVVKSHARKKATKKRTGRQALPADLPRKEVIIEPEEDVTGWKKIGEEVTEELDITPARFEVIRYIRPKYARPEVTENEEDKTIVIGKLPTRVIEKGIPSAGLLAHILVSKFVDHLPYYRLIQIFQRIGMKMNPTTINNWVAKSCELLEVLYLKHCALLFAKNYLMADETTIQVMDKEKKGKTHRGYFWVYLDPLRGQVCFKYDKGRGRIYPAEHLSEFSGFLQTDGYKVYDAFDKLAHIKLGACLAHVRRKFENAIGNYEEQAKHALNMMQELYAIERYCREEKMSPEQRHNYRQKESITILEKLKEWLNEQYDSQQHLPQSAFGKAVEYALKRWTYVKRFLDDGRYEIDNNLVENAIRPVAIGRKNYLFAGSHQGARWAAIIYSLVSSAKAVGHNPQEYLKDVLQRLPDQHLKNVHELLPMNWTPSSDLV